jgi:hypothetical protein
MMTRLSRVAAVAAIASASLAAVAAADQDLIAGWTIPTRLPIGAGNVPTGNSYLVPLAVNPDGSFNPDPNVAGSTPWDPELAGRADVGVRALDAGFALSSFHQLASFGNTPTSYTSPAGNGSAYAFSSNVWSAGDYYEAVFSTAGYTNTSFAFEMMRSATGPVSWEIIMSLDGGTSWQTLVAEYVPIVAGATGSGTTSWSANPANYQAIFRTELALGSVADDADGIRIRIQALVDAVNSTGGFAAGGAARIDNVMVYGDLIPAPGAIALLGIAGLASRRRRR